MLSKSLKLSSLLFVTLGALGALTTQAPRALAGGVTEVYLPRYQAEQLAADQPFTDLAVREGGGAKSGEVWFVGRTSLWRWQLADQSVRRFRLMDAQPQPGARQVADGAHSAGALKPVALHRIAIEGLHRILVDQGSGSFLVSSTDGLFDVEPATGRILHYPLPENVKPVTTGLFGVGDHIVWTTVNDLIQLDRYGKRLHVVPLPAGLKSAERLLWSPALKSFWVARGQSLGIFSLASEGGDPLRNPKESQSWLAPQPLAGLVADHNSTFAWTGSTVARFSDVATAPGKALDLLKVAGPRQLSLLNAVGTIHAYLFSDGTLEVYDLNSRRREAFKLPLPQGRDVALVQRMAMGGPSGNAQVALLVAGKPRVFSLAKDLSLLPQGDNVKEEIPKGK